MSAEELDADLIARVTSNLILDQGQVQEVLQRFENRQISKETAETFLRSMHELRVIDLNKLLPSAKDWDELVTTMREQTSIDQRQGRLKFALAIAVLGAVIGIATLILFMPDRDKDPAAQAVITAALLAAGAGLSFAMLRLHQQAVTAAERLHEKDVAVHFLRVAIGTNDEALRKELIEAGTTMFLGHHAPATLPLQPSDKPASLTG